MSVCGGWGDAETPNHNMSQSREKLLLLISDGSDGYLTQTRQNLLFVSMWKLETVGQTFL